MLITIYHEGTTEVSRRTKGKKAKLNHEDVPFAYTRRLSPSRVPNKQRDFVFTRKPAIQTIELSETAVNNFTRTLPSRTIMKKHNVDFKTFNRLDPKRRILMHVEDLVHDRAPGSAFRID